MEHHGWGEIKGIMVTSEINTSSGTAYWIDDSSKTVRILRKTFAIWTVVYVYTIKLGKGRKGVGQ